MAKRIIGKKNNKISLNAAFESRKPVFSFSVLNKFEENNKLEESPIILIGRNKLMKREGKFELIEIDAVINCM